ncbi:RnfABCDGE type electron transport complex subunit B [Buchnera aphidicola (Brachycaudus cardui)]|uniref:Ion-translocating oxidoreductase complex subunit B n=1 Tax=Buchnera aphidicola (Brachycaudus cardui) TaxID=557993 RepID=A0A4D6XXG1_9GAMM|nr:RnfABCDGE type electron transport complex subunit B [Buchnera aphidicola]QCI20727.1 RnfABCDGE type electron transport complex subunit B [Buchnera aphidicola (Brachycaudus cardui)]
MFTIFIFSVLSFFLGMILSIAAYKFQLKKDPAIEIINELLPQSQCAQCGYSGCYPYAEAIVSNSEKIDKCIPGGADLISQIAKVLNIEIPLDILLIKNKEIFNTTVLIDEKNCVGCAKCATFCPVDAIIGAPNFMHTVLQEFCTGCNICLSHCPTNCIQIKKRDL